MHTREQLWREGYESSAFKANFQDLTEVTEQWSQPASLEIVVNRCMSWSPLVIMSDEEKTKAISRITEIVRTGDGMNWLDRNDGRFTIEYETLVVTMVRRAK